jgi:biopolymer transport protein TolR
MAMNVGARGRGAIAEINVTPMADVMIVLLIIFMVVTPIALQPVSLPPAAHAREGQDQKPLVLTIATDGTLSIDERRVGPYEPALREVTVLVDADPLRPITIKADRGVTYAPVGAVLDACRRGGAENVRLATDRPEVHS